MKNDLNTELWQLGGGAVRRLTEVCRVSATPDILAAKATLAGTFAVMATEHAHDTSRGLRLLVLLMFEAELHGRHDKNNRVSLPTFVASITQERPGWQESYGIPPAMGQMAWETLARKVQRHQISRSKMVALATVHPQFTPQYWQDRAENLRDLPILKTVLH